MSGITRPAKNAADVPNARIARIASETPGHKFPARFRACVTTSHANARHWTRTGSQMVVFQPAKASTP